MTHRIAVISGDGAGPEVIAEARRGVDALGLELEWNELPWGSGYFHETGAMMPSDALAVVRAHDAVLLGAVGDPSVPVHVTLWRLRLPLRQGLDLWANVRPARLLDGVPSQNDAEFDRESELATCEAEVRRRRDLVETLEHVPDKQLREIQACGQPHEVENVVASTA